MKFNISELAKGKVMESLGMSAISTIKTLSSTIVTAVRDRFMFTMIIKENNEIYDAFQEWFYENYEEKFKSVTVHHVARSVDGSKVKNPGLARHYDPTNTMTFGVGYSQNSGTYMINYEGAFIQVSKGTEPGDKSMGERSVQYYTLTSSNKDLTKKLIEDIFSQYNTSQDQTKIFVSDLYGEWRLVKRINGKSLDNIIIKKDLHSKLVNDLVDFEDSREWYDNLNIPYKRGYLLYGPPGNGKTSLSIAIASEHKRNIYCLDVNKLRDDAALRQAFAQLHADSLLLIEDVDVAFPMSRAFDEKRKSSVTFGCLLNCLDGVYYKEGLLTIMTTNHIEKLDPALIRPGRMDLKIEVPNPGKDEVESYMAKFYGRKIPLETYTRNIPMAAVQGICITHKHDPDTAIAEMLSTDDLTIIGNYTVSSLEMDPDPNRDPFKENAEELAALEKLEYGEGDDDESEETSELNREIELELREVSPMDEIL